MALLTLVWIAPSSDVSHLIGIPVLSVNEAPHDSAIPSFSGPAQTRTVRASGFVDGSSTTDAPPPPAADPEDPPPESSSPPQPTSTTATSRKKHANSRSSLMYPATLQHQLIPGWT